jgi:hypothetical protein
MITAFATTQIAAPFDMTILTMLAATPFSRECWRRYLG